MANEVAVIAKTGGNGGGAAVVITHPKPNVFARKPVLVTDNKARADAKLQNRLKRN